VPQIFLVGYRATGKTTVGRIVATRLGWGFVDADAHLEAVTGRTVRDIIAADGEAAFRTLEAQVLRQFALDTAWDNHVVSTGGGVVLRPDNREFLRTGFVARLTADAATIHARMVADGVELRPNLTAAGGLAEVESLLASREPLYRQVADIAIDTVGRSPDEVAGDIIAGYFDAPSDRQD
jgi:shikimate kinase